MPKTAIANGKTFTFDDNTSEEQMAIAIDDYFKGQTQEVKKKENTTPTQKSGSQNGSVSPSTSPLNLSSTVKGIMDIGKKFPTLPSDIGLKTTKQQNIEKKKPLLNPTQKELITGDYIIQSDRPLSKEKIKGVLGVGTNPKIKDNPQQEVVNNQYSVDLTDKSSDNTNTKGSIGKISVLEDAVALNTLTVDELINTDETTANDFLVNSGLKSADRELYLKGQAVSNPKYLYDYEYNKIGSLYKAVEQRAKDYEAVLKQQYGDNFFEQAKNGDANILKNPDFNQYIALKEKQQSLSSKANGLINDGRFATVKKDLQEKEDAQLRSDATAKADKWYNPTDELKYLGNKLAYGAGHVVKMIAEIPALATSIDKGYDWTDKVADWGDRFSNNLIDAIPVSSDLQTGFLNKVAKVGNYKVVIDDNGNAVDVRDGNNFKVPTGTSQQILEKYNTNPKEFEIHNEKNWTSLSDNGLNTMIDMGIMILGTKGVGMLGAGQKLLKLTSMGIAYQQTKRDVYNEAIKKGLDPRNADVLSNIVGIAAGTSSALNPMEYNIASGKGLLSFLKSDGLNASKLALIRDGKLSVKEYAKEFVKKGLKNTIGENIEELGIENTTQALANNYFNGKISATDMQDGGLDEELHIFDKHGLETLLITAGSAFLMTPLEIKSQTQLNQQEALKMAIENPEDFVKIREMQVKKGAMTQEQVDAEKVIYDGVSKTYNAIKDDIKPELQPQLLALLTKKYNLSNKVSEIKDEALSAPYKAQLEEINKGIESIANGKKPSSSLVEEVKQSEVKDKVENNFEPATEINLQVDEFGDGKSVIDKVTEKTVIEPPIDKAVETPAAEMDNEQLNKTFEQNIANPTADEELSPLEQRLRKKSAVDIFNKRGIVNETEITPNELVEQGGEQNVSQGLQGEYQNNQGVQQSSGIGQVSQQEDVAEKVEKEAKKADIERRRQEELQTIKENPDITNEDINAIYLSESGLKGGTPGNLTTKINAKYDAELKALEQSTSTNQSESNPALSSVESTSKDITEKLSKQQDDLVQAIYDKYQGEEASVKLKELFNSKEYKELENQINQLNPLEADLDGFEKTLSESEAKDYASYRDIGYRLVAADKENGYKPFKVTASEKSQHAELKKKFDSMFSDYKKSIDSENLKTKTKAVEDALSHTTEKSGEDLSTKTEEITPKKAIDVDRNVDRNSDGTEYTKEEKKYVDDNVEVETNMLGIPIKWKTKDGVIKVERISFTKGSIPFVYKVFKNNELVLSTAEHDKAVQYTSDYLLSNDTKPTTETNQPVSEVADNTEQQGIEEAVQQGTDLFPKDAGLSGKELVGDALDRMADKIGSKKNLTQKEKTSLIKDVTDLAKGLIQMGKATLDNVVDKIKEEIRKRLPDLDDKTLNEIAQNVEDKVLLAETVKYYKDKGYTYEQAKERLDKINADYTEQELRDAWGGDGNTRNKKQAQDDGGVKKRVVAERAYEGTVREEVKVELEKLGLYREKVSPEERAKQADTIIDNIGEDMALEAVKNFDIRGAVATSVLARLIKRIDDKMAKLSATDADELSVLAKEQADLIELMGKEAYFGGEYNAQLGYEYLNSDIGYNIEKKIQEFKDQNNGVIPEDVEKKFRELDAEYQQLKKDYAEAEKRALEAQRKAEEKQTIENIKESVKREKKVRSYSKRGDDLIAEGLDELASYLGAKLSAEGTNRPQLTKALSKIGKGLIDKSVATIDNVFDKVKEYVASKFGDKVQIDELKDDIVKGIVDKMPKATIRDGKIYVPHQLIRDLVESGIEDINELATEIQSRLKAQHPDVEVREIRDAITGYGKTVNPNKEEIEEQIRKMKRIGKVESALEDVRNKKRPLRSGVQRDKLDAEERARVKELREAMKDLPMDTETLERELKTQLDAEKTRVQNRIDDLQREIDKNELTPRNARTTRDDAELKALKEKLEAVKKEHDEKFKNDDYKEKKRLELSKKLTQKRIEELQRRLRESDFSKTVRKPLIADNELIKLKAEKLRIQEQFDKEFYKYELKNRDKTQKFKDFVLELWGLTRALRATGEASFVGVQGLVNTISHPTHAKEAFKTAFKTMKSEKYTEDFLRGIKSQDWYPALKGSKLSLTEPHAELSAREELFVSDWFTYVWNTLGAPLRVNKKAYEAWQTANLLKAVERASVGYLDTLRVMRFLDGMEMLKAKGQTFENNPQAYKDMADVINTLTGRASLGKLEQNSELLAKVFFSPRNWASMLKQTILLPRQLYKWRNKTGSGEISVANKMALADLSKYVGLTTAMVAMFAAALNNDDDNETGVEMDPRSSDFGKIKLGKKRIDPWGGRIQQIVLASKLIMDSVKNSKGEVVPLGVPYKSPTKGDLLLRMATNKLSPSMAMVNEYLQSTVKVDKKTGESTRMSPYEYGGGEYDVTDKLTELYPIYWGTVSDLMKDDVNALNGILAFYAFFGGGVNVYDDKEKDKSKEKKTAPRLIQR